MHRKCKDIENAKTIYGNAKNKRAKTIYGNAKKMHRIAQNMHRKCINMHRAACNEYAQYIMQEMYRMHWYRMHGNVYKQKFYMYNNCTEMHRK